MAETKKPAARKPRRKALTPEARENQLIAMALDETERRLLDGTISNTLLAELIKRASTKAYLERELLEEQTKLARAKTEAYQSQKTSEEMYTKAIKAMREYNGHPVEESDEDIF